MLMHKKGVAHVRSRPAATAVDFFSIPSAIYTKWCAQTFPSIFGLFAIFYLHFSEFVTPSSDENENNVLLLKKNWKQYQNRPINRHTILVQTMSPLTNSAPASERDRKKTVTNTMFSHLTAGARCTISPKLCMVIELVKIIKNDGNHFSIQRSFSYRVHGKIWPKWPTRGFSAITP